MIKISALLSYANKWYTINSLTTHQSLSRHMIPINKPWMGEEEKREVESVLEENALTTAARDGGKRVRDFESQMKTYLGIKHVLAVNSGTAALHADRKSTRLNSS